LFGEREKLYFIVFVGLGRKHARAELDACPTLGQRRNGPDLDSAC
jgi:hypothetical protein